MTSLKTKLPIGVFDSGIGGISVLAELIKMLPHEEFIYYADTLHAPYGTKPEVTVRDLSLKAAEFLCTQGIKSIVVACNTATSAAIGEMRKRHPFPVIGMEPAVKLSVELAGKGKILVMATPLTLKSVKFNDLVCRYRHQAEIKLLPCDGLVDIIEKDHTNEREINEYLSGVFSDIDKKDLSAVVLGCTHYVLIKKEIAQLLGAEIRIIDGNYGTARRLKTVLQNECLLNSAMQEGLPVSAKSSVRFYMSGSEREVVAKYRQWLLAAGIVCESEFKCCR